MPWFPLPGGPRVPFPWYKGKTGMATETPAEPQALAPPEKVAGIKVTREGGGRYVCLALLPGEAGFSGHPVSSRLVPAVHGGSR